MFREINKLLAILHVTVEIVFFTVTTVCILVLTENVVSLAVFAKLMKVAFAILVKKFTM